MRIIAATGEFNLPTNFETQLTKYNVMLTTAGEQTNPITLPPTPNNLKLVGYSNRIDAYYKPLKDIQVTVYNGISIRQANLGIHTADDEDGISCTLYFGTGDLYSKFEDAKLASLPWSIIKSPDYDTQDNTERVQYLIDLLKSEYNSEPSNNDFFCAPVITEKDVTKRVNGQLYTEKFILNGFETRKYVTTIQDITYPITGTFHVYKVHKMEGEYEQTHVVDSADVNFTIGYGMTPFLKLKYIIDFLFTNYGYTFNYDDFKLKTRSDIWDYTAVINNVADSIYSGVLKYSQLLPDLTIKNFLSVIEKLFAAKFIVNELSQVVSLTRYEDILTANSQIDLTPYLASKPKTSEFTPVNFILNDTRVNSNTTDESEVKSQTIDLSFLNTTRTINTIPDIPNSLILDIIQIGSVIHKNSSLVIDGKTVKEEDKSMSELLISNFCRYPISKRVTNVIPDDRKRAQYKMSLPFLHQYTENSWQTELTLFQEWYSEFIDFYQNSNIPVSAKFRMPFTVLNAIDMSKPVLLNSQKMLIHTLKHDIEDKNATVEVDAELRTARSYANR